MTQGRRDGGAEPSAEGAAASAEAAPLDAAHAALLADPRYQFAPTDPPPPPPPGRNWLGDWLDGPLARAILEGFGHLMVIVFWLGVAALAGLVLWSLGMAAARFVRERRARPAPEAPAPYAPTPKAARTLLEDAAALARDGRYGEAVRLILRRSIEDMERQRPGAVRDAMTAREIGRLAILSDAARAGFGRIAALVERAAFAGRALSREEYEEARGVYEGLALGGRT